MTKRKPKTPSLPPFTWETHHTHLGGTAPSARPALTEQDVVDAETLDPDTGRVTVTHRRVWRTAQPPVLATVNRARRMALVEYADAAERAQASGGTSDPTGGGGGGGGSRSPSHSALVNVERLGRMRRALAGRELRVPAGGYRTANDRRMVRLSYLALADQTAIEGLGLRDVLRGMGVRPSEVRMDRTVMAFQEVAHLLARCCGYEGEAHAPEWMRNAKSANL